MLVNLFMLFENPPPMPPFHLLCCRPLENRWLEDALCNHPLPRKLPLEHELQALHLPPAQPCWTTSMSPPLPLPQLLPDQTHEFPPTHRLDLQPPPPKFPLLDHRLLPPPLPPPPLPPPPPPPQEMDMLFWCRYLFVKDPHPPKEMTFMGGSKCRTKLGKRKLDPLLQLHITGRGTKQVLQFMVVFVLVSISPLPPFP